MASLFCCGRKKSSTNAGHADEHSHKKTLKEFGYRFNDDGELRTIKTNAPFEFEVKKGDGLYNQNHYEALGEAVVEAIYDLLEMRVSLKRIEIPVDAPEDDPKGFFFASRDAWTCERLIILIHGSGPIRAGMWARKAIINEDLKIGSQLPFVEKGLELGYGMVLLNTNQNKTDDGTDRVVHGSEDPLTHALYVWDHFIVRSKARRIAIVAYSSGGYVAVNMAFNRSQEFIKRVSALALLDSVPITPKVGSPAWLHLRQVGKHWITSNKPLDGDVPQFPNDIIRCSAGTTTHDKVPSKAMMTVFNYIRTKCAD